MTVLRNPFIDVEQRTFLAAKDIEQLMRRRSRPMGRFNDRNYKPDPPKLESRTDQIAVVILDAILAFYDEQPQLCRTLTGPRLIRHKIEIQRNRQFADNSVSGTIIVTDELIRLEFSSERGFFKAENGPKYRGVYNNESLSYSDPDLIEKVLRFVKSLCNR